MKATKYNIVEGAYLADILQQPHALRDTLDRLTSSAPLQALSRELKEHRFQRVVLTGMGSSLYALYPLSLTLNASGQTGLLVETSELVHSLASLIDVGSLLVAVSQSGQSAEIVHLLDSNDASKNRAKVLAVTNTADSLLAQRADVTLLTHAGVEFSVSAKTYVTALMVLEFIGSTLTEPDGKMGDRVLQKLSLAEEKTAAYLTAWRNHVANLADILDGIRHLFLVGRGRSLAAAQTGALILKESTKFHAEGMSSAAFRHGPMEMLGSETFVAIFEGTETTRDLNDRLLHDIQTRGGRAERIGQRATHPALRLPPAPEGIQPILEILPIQMMTLALNARAGTEAGRFDFATKITTVE